MKGAGVVEGVGGRCGDATDGRICQHAVETSSIETCGNGE
jgi:hypothetical protein